MAGNVTASYVPAASLQMGQPSMQMLAGLAPPPPMPMPGATAMSMHQPVPTGAPVMLQGATYESYAPAVAATYGSYAPAAVRTTTAYAAPLQALVPATTSIPMAVQGTSYGSYAPATAAFPRASQPQNFIPAVTYGVDASAPEDHRVTAASVPAMGTSTAGYRIEAAVPEYRLREETRQDISAGQRVVGERPISREELFSTGNLVEGPEMAPPAPAPRPLTTSYGSAPAMSTPPVGYASRVAQTSSVMPIASASQQPLRTCYGDAASLNVRSAPGQFVSQSDFRHKINQLQEGRGVSHAGRSQGGSYAPAAYEPTATYAAASSAFDRIDQNHDGVISRSEFNQAMGRPGGPVAVI